MKALLIALLLAIPLSLSAASKDEEENPPLKQSDLPLPVVIDESQGDVPVTLDGETVTVNGNVNATVSGSVNATIQEPLAVNGSVTANIPNAVEVVTDPLGPDKFINPWNRSFKEFTRTEIIPASKPASALDNWSMELFSDSTPYLTSIRVEGYARTSLPDTAYPGFVTPVAIEVALIGYGADGNESYISRLAMVRIYKAFEPVEYEHTFSTPLVLTHFDRVKIVFRPVVNKNSYDLELQVTGQMRGLWVAPY
jgi:hypothetical protein